MERDRPGPAGAPRRVNPSIYIVDDDEAVRESVQTLLETYGYDVHVFASGEEFLGGFDGRRNACLVLDVNMPAMNGLELLRLVGKQWTALPVIMITGRSEGANKVRLSAEGAVDFLQKPFSDTAIVEAIERALGRT